jgi:hypothetical protein
MAFSVFLTLYGSPLYMILSFPSTSTLQENPPPPPLYQPGEPETSKKKKENLFAALAKCGLKIPLVLMLQTFLS